jgi:hypothetical protein
MNLHPNGSRYYLLASDIGFTSQPNSRSCTRGTSWAGKHFLCLIAPYRLHLLRPSPKIMLLCKIVLIAEWVLVTTPNLVLSIGAARTTKYKFDYAYSISQRIEPAIYAFVSLMLSSLYLYYAYIMFRRYRDKKVRVLLIRLLYTNLFLLALDSGNIIAEYVGGGIVQTCYLAFYYSFVSLTLFDYVWILLISYAAVESWTLDAQRNRVVSVGNFREVSGFQKLEHGEHCLNTS